ncbi:MAG: transpeptidase family protein [Deltaproteobacteria bacterium]|nr:transpeptidase family protein [Deltaproteobacteria bacterium]
MPDRKNTRWMHIRLILVAGLLVLMAGGISFRMWQLQVSQAEWLEGLAKDQYLRQIVLEPMRGAIVDRHGAPLAVSVMTDSIFVTPSELEDGPAVARALSKALDLNAGKLEKKLARRKHFTWIKRRIPQEEANRVRELKLAGVHFTRESRRFYPARELASSLIGFAGDGRGLEGLELLFDSRLRGSTTLAKGIRDARGRTLFSEGMTDPDGADGVSLVLTLDLTIQEIAQRELERAVTESKAKGGMVVVMDPATSDILAMANVPNFNPNMYWTFKPSSYRNRSVTDCFEPGSTMKIFTIGAALQEGVVKPGELIDCEKGRLAIGRHHINDSHRGLGKIPLREVLVHSSNVGTAKLGMALGKPGLHRSLKNFGFGLRTGVDLPGESRCILRPFSRWSDVGLATISFGQGISVTPLQMTSALCSVASGGILRRPRILKALLSEQSREREQFEPDVGRRVLDGKWASTVRDMMVGVTEPGGTGTRAAVPGFAVAGKTGTAQKADLIAGGYSKDKRVASFMGFVPADSPRLAILVVVDEPTTSPYGGTVAAPPFARIAEAVLGYLGVFAAHTPEPVAEKNIQIDKPRSGAILAPVLEEWPGSPEELSVATGVIRMPDLRGLSVREAVGQLSPKGLDVIVSGSGRVKRQRPAAGKILELASRVTLELEIQDAVGSGAVSTGS